MILGGCTLFLILFLIIERLLLNRSVRLIPLRICVTGTRGKSTVVRFLASSLREAGLSVMAKTTGSKPRIIYPKGEEREISRRGSPSILEGKRFLKEAAQHQVQVVVSEMMSIQPESHFIESQRILNPHVLVITNVRCDHLAQMGGSREEIASCIASSIPKEGTIFVPEEEFFSIFGEWAKKLHSRVIQIPGESIDRNKRSQTRSLLPEFDENISLSLEVTHFLGVKKEVAWKGIAQAQPDFGSPQAWRVETGSPPKSWLCVSCFAANDPQSTRKVVDEVERKKWARGRNFIGLLSLREDRGDRTLQWINGLKKGTFSGFEKIYIVGRHARVVKRILRNTWGEKLEVLKERDPQGIMDHLQTEMDERAVLVGMGNIGGLGERMVGYWRETGKPV
ncbi:poly-gamma-glutamate synthase PgsB [bacterium]|nr:poly-gamma-glutamate synthase PgsB [bacterium]